MFIVKGTLCPFFLEHIVLSRTQLTKREVFMNVCFISLFLFFNEKKITAIYFIKNDTLFVFVELM